MVEKQLEVVSNLAMVHELIEHIGKLRAAIVKTKKTNDELIAEYKSMANGDHTHEEVICFQGIVAGLEEANRNLRICISEVDRRIL